MRYGFVIDQNRCIGCHACTVACKEEHNVPIGVYRTWVKYIEKGEFPDTKRYFSVLRCNHCDDAPCIEICPTVALFRRSDGIVDFDNSRCIGCKSCMQACPYDALYIDPDTQTAAKCNFCAHRVEVGLEPACVIVCPEQAIIAGDLDDPESRISRTVATQKTSVRKAGKGTRPKLFYLGVDGDLLEPAMLEPQSSYLWADKNPAAETLSGPAVETGHGAALGGAREVYDVPHPALWGGKIASYLWTKSIAAGVLLLAAFLLAAGYSGPGRLLEVASPLVALAFTGLTTLLLILDLKRPERFFYILFKPNLKSWLVWGGYILFAYGLLSALWLFFGITQGRVPDLLLGLTALLAIASACYSAFLFAQAKGRDLWQSPLFFWRLLAQAVTAGSATLLILGAVAHASPALISLLSKVLYVSLVFDLAMTLGEISLGHASENVRRAIAHLKEGPLSGRFWWLAVGLGNLVPILLLMWVGLQDGAAYFTSALVAFLVLIGLWVFEDLWIKAGQSVPLS